MMFCAHWRECFAASMVVCFLASTQVLCLTTELTPSDPPEAESRKNTHAALILEGSGLILSPVRHHGSANTPELQPTPKPNILHTPTTKTTHLSHVPLPSSEQLQLSGNTVTPSLDLPTERLIFTSTTEERISDDGFTSDFALDVASSQLQLSSQQLPTSQQLLSSQSDDLMSSSQDSAVTQEVKAPSSFHTPLMSLLMASSSIHAFPDASATAWQHATTSVTTTRYPTVPENDLGLLPHAPIFESDNRKLLMLVLRAEDCAKFNKEDFEKMLSNLLEKYGFADAVPQVSTAKCYSHLSINLTYTNSTPTLRFLPNVDSKSNVTVDVLNRTFRIVKMEKVDLKMQSKPKHNSNSTYGITAVTKHESLAYIALGVCFGLIILICLSICCIKFCCGPPQPRRRLKKKFPKHERLGPEDYVLTPLPKTSTSYQHNQQRAGMDVYCTNSAKSGPSSSVAHASNQQYPGVIQPFDTSIVPLEDSTAVAASMDRPYRDPHQDLRSAVAKACKECSKVEDKVERNYAKKDVNKPKSGGVTNPTFERY